MNKAKQIINIAVFGVIILSLTLFLWLSPDKDISVSERRPLTQFEEVLDEEKRPQDDKGNHLPFEEIVEKYLLDQFPARDKFRQLKAFFYMDVLKKNDNNDIYVYQDTVIKIEDKLSKENVEYAVDVSNGVVEKYFPNNKVYFSVIPDKHYYAAMENGYPTMDYMELISIMKDGMTGMNYIDITDNLKLSDYYKTDSHWSQEKITGVAQELLSVMRQKNVVYADGYWKVNTLSPFYGVYYGQSALSLSPDEIKYLTNSITDGMTMTVLDNSFNLQTYKSPYIVEMFNNKDPYDLFMGGAQSAIVIDNPNAKTDKELVVFRDSFGSSIVPLVATEYKKVFVLDLRYINPKILLNLNQLSRGKVPADFIEFDEDQDVLFLYSAGLVNTAKGLMQNIK